MKIVIAGAGEMGSHLARMLSGNGHDITVIDGDQFKIAVCLRQQTVNTPRKLSFVVISRNDYRNKRSHVHLTIRYLL